MKRLLLMFFFLLMLSSCNSEEEDFNIALQNMNELTQSKMFITIDGIPILNGVKGTLTIDHERTESLMLGERTFTFVQNGETYYLKKYEDEYFLFYDMDAVNNMFQISSYEKFHFEDFTFDGTFYRSNIVINGMSDIVLKLEDDYIKDMYFNVMSGEDILTVYIEYMNYETASITLPEYTIMSDLEYLLFPFTSMGFTYTKQGNGFTLSNLDTEISYHDDDNYYTIKGNETFILFYPETNYIYLEDNVSLDLEIYFSYEEIPLLDSNEFKNLVFLYEYINDSN